MSHPTRIGQLTLAATDQALIYCAFDIPEEVAARIGHLMPLAAEPTLAQQRVLHAAREQIDAYLTGRQHAFDLPLDLSLATDFVRLTVGALSEIAPYGRTTTYGALAAALGRPRSARAVGRALGANPLCVVLPCHRAVGAGGRLTGYAGGLDAKAFLLDLEQSGCRARRGRGSGPAAAPAGHRPKPGPRMNPPHPSVPCRPLAPWRAAGVPGAGRAAGGGARGGATRRTRNGSAPPGVSTPATPPRLRGRQNRR